MAPATLAIVLAAAAAVLVVVTGATAALFERMHRDRRDVVLTFRLPGDPTDAMVLREIVDALASDMPGDGHRDGEPPPWPAAG